MEAAGLQNPAWMWVRFPNDVQKNKQTKLFIIMIYLPNFKFIYKVAKILITASNQEGKSNYVENYLKLIKDVPVIDEFMSSQPWDTKVICSFTAAEIYDNPSSPEATPLMVVNNMYSFILLDTSEVKNTKDCPNCSSGSLTCGQCGGSGENYCSHCDGNGEVDCEYCGGEGEDSEGNPCDDCQGGGKVECGHCQNGFVICDECDGSGQVSCGECEGSGEIESEEYVTVDPYLYLSTDQELLNILKTRLKNKQELDDIYKKMIDYNSKVLFIIGRSGSSKDINVSDNESIKKYSEGYYVSNINKIRGVYDISVAQLVEIPIDIEKYFGN